MKIVFIASLYDKEAHRFHYLSIVNLLEDLGHTVLSSHVTQYEIDHLNQSYKTNAQFHQKVFRSLRSADAVVAEVTQQSLGVGYTIAEALKQNAPVLALSSLETSPLAVFLENHSTLITHQYATIRGLEKELPFLIKQLRPKRKKKFNVFLPAEMDAYLVKTAQEQNVSKSEYLRQLLEKDQQQQV